MGRVLSDQLRWVDAQDQRLRRLVAEWAGINSGSYNLPGLRMCTEAVVREFEGLGGRIEWLHLPPHQAADESGNIVSRPLGEAVRITKRPDAARRVLLAIHVDTVYGADHPFQNVALIDHNTLGGPGVVDAKGGLVVMLAALEALERSVVAGQVGWTVFINPDEELGSPGSGPLFAEMANEHALGMLFEPALPDGALVAARKGSGNFSAVMTGRSAHAGRDPQAGRNAIHALADFVVDLADVGAASPGISVNVGRIEGGGALNVVPERASCGFNVRVASPAEQTLVEARLSALVDSFSRREGYGLVLHGTFGAPPKPLDAPTQQLLEHVALCGRELGMDLAWRDTGGTCDGNRLAAAGLPNVDSLGPRGGALHGPDEFLRLDSLVERGKLSALLLMKLAAGEIEWPAPRGANRERSA